MLAHSESLFVGDVSQDPRFYKGVDEMTHMTTRTLLCAPLRTRGGNLGVIEVVNPTPAPRLRIWNFSKQIVNDIAVAYEDAAVQASAREVVGLRQAVRVEPVGGLLTIGVLFIVRTLATHAATALPLRELPTRPGMLIGLLASAVGVGLVAVAHGTGSSPRARTVVVNRRGLLPARRRSREAVRPCHVGHLELEILVPLLAPEALRHQMPRVFGPRFQQLLRLPVNHRQTLAVGRAKDLEVDETAIPWRAPAFPPPWPRSRRRHRVTVANRTAR